MASVKARAGELRHRVDIKLPSTSRGTRGEKSGSDTTAASSIPCSIETLSGREVEIARQLYPSATLAVELRYGELTSLTTEHYFVFGSRQLNIGHLDNVDQRNILWRALCGEDK